MGRWICKFGAPHFCPQFAGKRLFQCMGFGEVLRHKWGAPNLQIQRPSGTDPTAPLNWAAANGGVTNGGLRGVWLPFPEIGRNRPFSPFFCLFRPFLEGAKSTWEIQKTEEEGLFPQISSDLLKPPSLKPPFAALQLKTLRGPVRAIRANGLKPAIRNFLVPRNAIREKGGAVRTLRRFARIKRFERICESIRANWSM